MKKLIAMTLLLGGSTLLCAQKTVKIPAVYKPVKSEMYKKGWIDFNKNGVKDVYEDPNASLDARIEDLLSQMTLEEKTCQMVTLYGYKRVLKDDLPTPKWKQMLWKDGIGAIDEHLNGFQQWGLPPSDNPYVWPASRHAWALNEVQRFFIEETRLGIPVDFTNEGIRGVESYRATNFPTQLGLGHTWNRELIHQVGLITGREARMLGYTNVYAPILDVGRDQRWGRYEEVYGESPYLVAELGIEMVRGMQHNHQVAATGKHFVAYSNNKGAREGMARVDPQMSPREVEMIHVYPFKRVIKEAGLLGVMSSYNDYDGVPIQGSYYWLTTRLRGEMGFRGYVVSDSDAVEYLYTKHSTAKDMKEAVRQSVEAGLNVRCTFRSPDSYVLPLRELVKEGGLSEEVINDRVRDILRVKFLVGLFDTPYQTDLAGADKEIEKAENESLALQASRESLVLLKNENNVLPLDINNVKKIAVCGPNADEEGYALTHYGPLAVEVTTVLEGIRQKTEGKAEVLYTKGCDLVDANWPESELIDYPMTDSEQAEIDKAVENARQADVAVVVLGGGQQVAQHSVESGILRGYRNDVPAIHHRGLVGLCAGHGVVGGRRGRAAVFLRLRCAAADADAVLVLVAQRGNEIGALTFLLAAAGALAYRVAAFRAGGGNGGLDELMAQTALLRDNLPDTETMKPYRDDLLRILDHLMRAASYLATEGDAPKYLPPLGDDQVGFLENRIDAMQATLRPIAAFTLPGGHPVVSLSHVCRTVCRRCERRTLTLAEEYSVPQSVMQYLNRLSDYFYTLGRKLTDEFHVKETYWVYDK